MQFISKEQVWRQIIKPYLGLPALLNQEIFKNFASALPPYSPATFKSLYPEFAKLSLKQCTYTETEHMM